MLSSIGKARQAFHADLISRGVLVQSRKLVGKGERRREVTAAANADAGNKLSREIAGEILLQLHPTAPIEIQLSPQRQGSEFERAVQSFLAATFLSLNHIRPGNWQVMRTESDISKFDQYHHLADLKRMAARNAEVAALLGGDYLIKPDILVFRGQLTDSEINQFEALVGSEHALLSPLREGGEGSPQRYPLLHACVSCKWSMRSDRAQNSRSESLTLVRARKGRVPHIVVVTAEPTPRRLESLALGTGDLDCVYHFALNELQAALPVADPGGTSVAKLKTLVESRRLRDISDLPLDLAI